VYRFAIGGQFFNWNKPIKLNSSRNGAIAAIDPVRWSADFKSGYEISGRGTEMYEDCTKRNRPTVNHPNLNAPVLPILSVAR
jgi:hypothetical protein